MINICNYLIILNIDVIQSDAKVIHSKFHSNPFFNLLCPKILILLKIYKT